MVESSVVSVVEQFVREYMGQYKDSSHDWLHVDRVRKLALKLAARENDGSMDFELVELAAMLHDVGDFKFAKEGETGNDVISDVLSKNNYPRDKIDAVLEITQNVSFRHELEHGCTPGQIKFWKEFSVVQDADRLDAIGAIGIGRCFAFNGKRNLPFYIPGEKPNTNITAEEYNQQTAKKGGSARSHFDEKLVKLAGMMKSEAGKSEAIRRQEFLLSFKSEFDQDCGLEY